MSQTMATQLVDEISNDDGVIDAEVPGREVALEVDIRDDDLSMLEGADGRLFLSPPEGDELFEVVPGVSGAGIETVEEGAVEMTTLTEIDPADPAEQPDVADANADIVRMD